MYNSICRIIPKLRAAHTFVIMIDISKLPFTEIVLAYLPTINIWVLLFPHGQQSDMDPTFESLLIL